MSTYMKYQDVPPAWEPPANAEKYHASVFARQRKVSSKFAPNLVEVQTYVVCPGCDTELEREIGHRGIYSCDCGMYMHEYGTQYIIWR